MTVLDIAERVVTASRAMSAISLKNSDNTGAWPERDDTEYRAHAATRAAHLDALARSPARTLLECKAKARAIQEACCAVTMHPEAALSLAADLIAL